MILDKNEVIGLEDIINLRKDLAKLDVRCFSLNCSAYYINRSDFVRILKAYKFDEQLIKELEIKHQIYLSRIAQMKRGYRKLQNTRSYDLLKKSDD